MSEPAAATEAPREAVLCRYNEIFLKGLNRSSFERRLVDNMRRALGRMTAPARVERLHGRILVWPAAGRGAEALARLERVFGLASLSPVRLATRDLDAIAEAAIAETQAAVSDGRRPTFKVEARRADKRFPLASPEIARQVGARVIEATGLPVDVHRPELTIGVEVGFEHVFVYARSVPGPGGLPVGSSGKVDLLLSGGIDSPVAGWMALKRGCHVAATYFHSPPFTGERTRDKVKRLAEKLADWQGEIQLSVVPFTNAQKALRDAGKGKDGLPRLAVVLYRRMMMRVATELARSRGALALVTGEALGQVASQTLENLTAIQEAAGLPVLRPLVAHDKLDTIAFARRIGTYDLSIEPYEDACSLFVPDHPETHARLADCQAIESRVDVAGLVAECVAGVEKIACRGS